ncbi:PEP-CTERM sorting domain-containing protein [Thalassomonas sp. RHCl1]|uniref:PEP-CTERM sorting domain-containing protein n=1 Tax=Thalassomonas sp. RHCl1 TaxID=2995320 RepID=UPI00248BA278|nr:PEP-CTERM sorting domain-containing protein [Thalassomonas sp. RHCl1]
MKIFKTIFLTAIVFLLNLSFAFAGHLPPAPCNVADVQLNSIQLLDGSPVVNVPPIDSSECYGAFRGNNSLFTKPSNGNLGYDDDGWLNSESPFWSGPGAFIENADLLDLDGEGDVDDPGWIYLGKDEGAGFKGETSTDGVDSYTFIDDLLTMSNCLDKDDNSTNCVGGDAVKGDWAWTPPATNPQALLDLLGGLFFDQVAIIFKSGKQFAMYDFDIGDLGLDPVLAGDFNFAFTGTWDMSNTLGKHGLSNYTLWARDPTIETTDIPEPSTLALFSLFILLIALRQRQWLNQ